eukprot:2563371-Alexandrium_andersonii.AAC.1
MPWAKPGFGRPTVIPRVADPRRLWRSCSPKGPGCTDATPNSGGAREERGRRHSAPEQPNLRFSALQQMKDCRPTLRSKRVRHGRKRAWKGFGLRSKLPQERV